MDKYICVELVNNVCQKWQAYQSSVDILAITAHERDLILSATLVLWFGAYGLRQVLNVVLRRRY